VQGSSTVPLSAKGITGPAYEPQALEGEVFERMKMDPELQAHRRQLFTGIAIVTALIVLAIIMHFTSSEDTPGSTQKTPSVTQAEELKHRADESPKLPSNTIALRTPDQPLASNTTKEPKKLTYSLAGQSTEVAQPASTSVGKAAPASAILARPVLGEQKQVQQALPVRPNLEPPPSRSTMPTLSSNRPLMRPRVNGAVPEPLDLKAAAKAVAAFLSAPSLDARLPLVADAANVEAAMRSYYSTHLDGPIPYTKIMASQDSEFSTNQSVHTVFLKDGTTREVCVIHGDNGTFSVDWPSLVVYSEMDWSEFMTTKLNQSKIFRVYAESDNHFGNFFADSNSLRCIKLTNPLSATTPVIYAYAEKQSIIGRELDHYLQGNAGKPVKLTLRLKYPSNADEPNQVWVTGLISAGWAVPPQTGSQGNIGLR
jgi:hypothetical protein